MSGSTSVGDRGLRESIRFYLLDHETTVGKAVDVALLALDVVFVAVYVAQTYPISEELASALWRVEVGVALVFLAEYALRLYGARDRVAEATNPYAVVDLVAILPTLAAAALATPVAATSVGFLRALGVVRALRFYRFTRDPEFFFGRVSAGTLRGAKLLLTVLVLLFVSAGAFYAAEHPANPGVATFGDAFYFMVVTLATVGFGDITPVTTLGRWVTVVAILAAVIVVPWQARRIVRAWTRGGAAAGETRDVACPECGLATHDADADYCKSCGSALPDGDAVGRQA